MVYSKVFLDAFGGSRVRSEQSSYLSVNPTSSAGSALFVGSCADRAALGGQVASKLALQHFLSGAENTLYEPSAEASPAETSLAAMEVAFRNSNTAVYEFGHKMAAGGRMATSLISVLIREGSIVAGRVGQGACYLARKGQIFPFFSPKPQDQEVVSVGANSLVSVELASVSAQAGDIVLVFSDPVPQEEELDLGHMVSLLLPKFELIYEETASPSVVKATNSIDGTCALLTSQIFGEKGPAFSSILALGPDVTFLEAQASIH